MATKPTCTYCGEFQGVLMVTNLDDGDTQIVCPNDILMWTLSMTAQLTTGMPADVAQAYGSLLDQIKANDPREAKPAPRRRTSKPAAAPQAQSEPGSSEGASLALVDLPEPCPQCGHAQGVGDETKLACAECGTVLATADEATG